MRSGLAAALITLSPLVWAQEEPLQLVHEYPVAGFTGGNLSGLTQCAGSFWAVSDRQDQQYFRLIPQGAVWQAEAQPLALETPDNPALPWWISAENYLIGKLRGGQLDFEAISCDGQGNRYLLSEAYLSIAQVSPDGQAQWLTLPDNWLAQAQNRQLLMSYNALAEGLTISPDGQQLWLAAERDQRGLITLHRDKEGHWQCPEGCIVLAEGGKRPSPMSPNSTLKSLDFSDVTWHQGQLFTLERLEQKICRRSLPNAAVERCWSFAQTALQPQRRYPLEYPLAEALWLNEDYAYIGLDNNETAREDGEQRPIIWQFKAPPAGWNAP